MKLLLWNVRGLGNTRAFQALKKACSEASPHMVFLSETKLFGIKAIDFWNKLGYEFCEVVHSRGKKCGLLLLWKNRMNLKVLSKSKGHIDAVINQDSGQPWRFSGLYGHLKPHKRTHSWNLLRKLSLVSPMPWMVGGDFNEILSVQDKKGGVYTESRSRTLFRETIDESGLMELRYTRPFWKG